MQLFQVEFEIFSVVNVVHFHNDSHLRAPKFGQGMNISNFVKYSPTKTKYKKNYKKGIKLVLHKIQDFQESCIDLVLKARQDCYTQDQDQDQDKIKNVKTKTRQN